MAGVRFEISADTSQLTAGLDAASAKVESWASSASGKVGATMASARAAVSQAKADLAAFNLEISAAASEAGLSNAKYIASIKSVEAEQQRLQTAVRESTTAYLVQKAATDELAASNTTLSVGGVNVENMLTRVAIRFVAMELLIRPAIDLVKELVTEHSEWNAAMKQSEFQLTSQGEAAVVSSGKLAAFAESMSRLGKFSAAGALQSFVELDRATQSSASAMLLVQDAEDLAAASGQKLETVSAALASTIETGSASALEKFGVHLDETDKALLKVATEEERAAILHDALFRRFSGAMEDGAPVLTFWEKLAGYVKVFADSFPKDQAPIMFGGEGPSVDYSAFLGNARDEVLKNRGLKTSAEQRVVDDNADKYDAVMAAVEKLDPSLDKLGKKQAEINLQFVEAKKQLDAERDALLAGGEAATAKITNIDREIAGLDEKRRKQLAIAADDFEGKAAAKEAALAEEVSKTAIAAGDWYDKMVRAADIPNKVLDPLGAAVDAENQKFDVLAASSDRWAGKLVDDADHAVSSVMAIGPAIDFYRQKADEAVAANYWSKIDKQIQNLVDSADRQLDAFGEKTKDSLASFFSGAQLDAAQAKIDKILGDYKTTIAAVQAAGGMLGLTPEETKAWIDLIKQGGLDAAKAVDDGLKGAARGFESELERWGSDFGSVLEGALTGGGKGFSAALNSIFKEESKNFSGYLENAIVVGFGGMPDPKAYAGGKNDPAYIQAAAKGDPKVNAYVQGGIDLLGLVQQAGAPGESVGMAAVQGAAVGVAVVSALTSAGVIATGANIGGVAGGYIGAAIGAIVAAAIAYFSPADTTGKYYQHINISDNQVDFTGGASQRGADVPGTGYSADQTKQIFESIQKTIDQFVNGYTQVLLKFKDGIQLLAVVTELSGTEIQNTWNSAASKGFNDKMNAWIAAGLPEMIADNFWNPIAKGLEENGISAAEASAIRDAANKMVPKDAMQFISDLVDDVLGINDLMKKLSQPVYGSPFDDTWSTSLSQQARDAAHPDVIVQLGKGADDLYKMGEAMGSMDLPGQVAEMGQIKTALQSRYDMEIQYLQQIQSIEDSVNKSYLAARQQFILEGMVDKNGKPDYQAQVDYEKKYLDRLTGEIAITTDPSKLNDLQQSILQTIEQIVQLGGAMGPDAKAAYLKWGEQALDTAQSALDAQLRHLGDQIDQANAEFEAKMQPFIDAFEQGAGATQDNTTATVNATTSINDLGAAASRAADYLSAMAAGGHVPTAPSSASYVPTPADVWRETNTSSYRTPGRTGRSQDDNSDFRDGVAEFRAAVREGIHIVVVQQSADDFPTLASGGRG